MFKLATIALFGSLAAATTATLHAPVVSRQEAALPPVAMAAEPQDIPGLESLIVYYSPLRSTEVARFVGFGLAHHMAIVYTDRAGLSRGVSSGPSDLTTPQSPANAWGAVLALAGNAPSPFGFLVSDPHNDTPFVRGRVEDVYTKDAAGARYPHAVAMRGRDLSSAWASILATYRSVGGERLVYSPINQNSKSLAGTALRRIGVQPAFSNHTVFAPGAFTLLPLS